jgi:hypothetical protein
MLAILRWLSLASNRQTANPHDGGLRYFWIENIPPSVYGLCYKRRLRTSWPRKMKPGGHKGNEMFHVKQSLYSAKGVVLSK